MSSTRSSLADMPARTLSRRDCVAVGATLVAAAVGSVLLRPRLHEAPMPAPLDEQVPRRFGAWVSVPTPYVQTPVAVARHGEAHAGQPYDDVLMRTYFGKNGAPAMLALAYARAQRQEVKVHRPELCYVAQGYQVMWLRPSMIAGVPGQCMLVRAGYVTEAVSYWMRIGRVFSEDAVVTRLHILREGLQGRVPDGILVRASSPVSRREGADAVHARLEAFLEQLVSALAPGARALLVG